MNLLYGNPASSPAEKQEVKRIIDQIAAQKRLFKQSYYVSAIQYSTEPINDYYYNNAILNYILRLELLNALGILQGKLFYPCIGNDYFVSYLEVKNSAERWANDGEYQTYFGNVDTVLGNVPIKVYQKSGKEASSLLKEIDSFRVKAESIPDASETIGAGDPASAPLALGAVVNGLFDQEKIIFPSWVADEESIGIKTNFYTKPKLMVK